MAGVPSVLRNLPRRARDKWGELKGYTPTDRNLYYLCLEIIPIGLASGALSFNGAFVLKLGASNELIGAMASLPALVVILLTVPAARFVESRRDRRPWVVGSLGVSRILYLLIGLVPWLLPAPAQALAIVALIILQQVPLAFFQSAFWALISEVCPPDRRSALFSTRTMLLAASVAGSAFLSGLFLDWLPFPLNFQILNLAAFFLAQWSTYLVSKVEHPPNPAAAPASAPAPEAPDTPSRRAGRLPAWWRSLNREAARAFMNDHRAFVNFNLATLVCWAGAWAAGPLYTIFLVRELQVSNAWLGTAATLGQIGVMLAAPVWHRIIGRKGNLWVVLRTVLLTGLYPMLIVMVPHPTPILGISFVNTLNDTGINIAHTAIFLDVIPPRRRSTFIALHTALMNMGAMVAPVLSTALAGAIGVSAVLVGAGVVRTIGGALFWVLPPVARSQPAQPASAETRDEAG
jgi:MFS family permease